MQTTKETFSPSPGPQIPRIKRSSCITVGIGLNALKTCSIKIDIRKQNKAIVRSITASLHIESYIVFNAERFMEWEHFVCNIVTLLTAYNVVNVF